MSRYVSKIYCQILGNGILLPNRMNSIFNEDPVARLKFHNQFLYGYILILTLTVNLLCGLYALRASLGVYGPGLFPTV